MAGTARAGTFDCNSTMAADAPAAYESTTCQGICAMSGTTWICDTTVFCGSVSTSDAIATTVSNYNSTGADYSTWVECVAGGAKACCAHTETAQAPIYSVELDGTPGEDTLSFHDPGSGSNLQPAKAHDITGVMHGMDDNCDLGDILTGSDYVGADYGDWIYGDDGCDFIYGGLDKDVLYGGPDHDEIYGGGGNDRIDGGTEDDYMDGGTGNDTICDDTWGTGALLDEMQGGDGADALYYFQASGSPANALAPASSAGNGTDDCGNSTIYGNLPWGQCEVNLTSAPANCPP